MARTARWSLHPALCNSCRCPKSWRRSIRRGKAMDLMPVILPPGSAAANPNKRQAPRIGSLPMCCAIPAHFCRAAPPPSIEQERGIESHRHWLPSFICNWEKSRRSVLGRLRHSRYGGEYPIQGVKRPSTAALEETSIKRKITRRSAVALAAAAPVALASRGFAQSPIDIKFSHVVANDTPKGKGSLKFKELAEKYTGGKIKMQGSPHSTPNQHQDKHQALQVRSVQMLGPTTAKFAPLGAKEF